MRRPINTTTAGQQFLPATVGLESGGYVTAWLSPLSDGSPGVYFQRFDSVGRTIGTETYAGPAASSSAPPLLIGVAGGGFLIDGHAYNAAGTASGGTDSTSVRDRILATPPNQFLSESDPRIARLADGGYVTAEQAPFTYVFADGRTQQTVTVLVRWYSHGGAAEGQYYLPVQEGGFAGVSANVDPAVAALGDGGFAVSWSIPDRHAATAKAEIFEADGTPGPTVLVGFVTGASPTLKTNVAGTADGGFIVSVTSAGTGAGTGGGPYTYIKQVTAEGVGSDLVGLSSADRGDAPAIVTLLGGDTALAWAWADVFTEVVGPTQPADTTPPGTPSILGIVDNVGPIQGLLPSGQPTDDNTPMLRVSLQYPGAAAGDYIRAGGYLVEPRFVEAADLARGFIDLVVYATPDGVRSTAAWVEDEWGNVGQPSAPFELKVDTAAPAAPQIAQVVDDVGPQQGDVASGQRTDDTSLQFDVSLSGTGAQAGDTAQLVLGGQRVAWSLLTDAQVQQGSVRINAPTLQNGSYTFAATILDQAGNTSAESGSRTVIVDTSGGGSSGGLTLTGNDQSASTLTGGPGDDTLTAKHRADVLTGAGGADTFRFEVLPWSPGHVTDFTVGTDRLDLSALFQASGYTGADPVRDGYLSFVSDGAGGTRIYYDPDGPAQGSPWPFLITTLDKVSPSGVTWAQLSGGGGPPPSSGVTLTGNDQSASTLAGGAGNDTLTAGHQADVLTGNGGADTFAFKVLPWSPGHVTDFTIGQDRLDLSALFRAAGYSGNDPVRDGYVSFASDGAGGTRVYYSPHDGSNGGYPYLLTTLDHIAASGSLTWAAVSGGSGSPTPPPEAGVTLTGNDQSASTLTGGAGNDTLTAAHQADVLTGAGGADRFVISVLPWSPGHVTDFTPGTDVLDLRPVFQAAGYSGSNPTADGTLSFLSNGQGDTRVYLDVDGSGGQWPYLLTTLDHISPSQIGASDWLFH